MIGSTWFSYDPGVGFEIHETEEKAREAAEAYIEDWGEQCDPNWSEEVGGVCYGRITHWANQEVTRVENEGKDDEREYWDYKLEAVEPIPTRDGQAS